MQEFDPVEYGKLVHSVESLEKKVDNMEKDIKELLALANKGKGGLWFGMAVVSAVSVLVGWLISLTGVK